LGGFSSWTGRPSDVADNTSPDTLAATAHTAKATTRAAANTSPEPFSNIGLSLAGDALVPAMLWLSWEHPVLFFVALFWLAVIATASLVLAGRAVTRREYVLEQ